MKQTIITEMVTTKSPESSVLYQALTAGCSIFDADTRHQIEQHMLEFASFASRCICLAILVQMLPLLPELGLVRTLLLTATLEALPLFLACALHTSSTPKH